MEDNNVSLPMKNQYKVGSVTYIVDAHYPPDGPDLKTKITRLIKSDVPQKTNCTFAVSMAVL